MVDKQNFGLFFSIITAATVLLDQVTKFLVVILRPEWNLLIADLHLITNTGAGFGLFQDKTIILGIISLLVSLGMILYYHKIPKHYSLQLFSALFLGGVIGNLIDRFFRGYVVDFIDLRFWPAFNVADAAISLAVVGLIYHLWRDEKDQNR
ncbi:signal peptidase II [Candidatus Woesearchaeota archaeon]|nr:signal peptidase II [Candidatus Woesearchaeota archaeon]